MNESVFPGLVRAAAAGDQNALTELYNLTYNDVYNTAKFLVKDEDAALDILQDSYIKAFASLNALSNPERFRPWIKRIAHNMAIDQLRKKQPIVFSAMAETDDNPLPEFQDERTDNLPDVSLDQQETARLIRKILDSLPEEQRTCVTLYYYEEFSVKEIAAEFGIPAATVKSRLQYGRRKIEAAVRDLEKRGTKLYGMSPIAFFLFLLRNCSAELAADVSEAVCAEVLQKTLSLKAGTYGTTAAAKSSAAAGKAAAGAAAHAAVGTKVIAGILAVLVVAGGITAAVRHRSQTPKPDQPVPASEQPTAPSEEPTVTPESVPQTPSVTASQAYADLIRTYRDFFTDYNNGVDVSANPNYEPLFSIEYVRFLMNSASNSQNGTIDLPYYALLDINGDGTDELILAHPENYYEPDVILWRPFEVYAFDGEKAVPLVQNTGIDLGYVWNIPNIHIMPEVNGLGLDYGNGLSPKWFFTLPAGGSELEMIEHYEPSEGLPRHWVGQLSGSALTDEELDANYPNCWNYDDRGYRSIEDF